MPDVKLIKTLEVKPRGRKYLYASAEESAKLLELLKKKRSKKELITLSGLKPLVVDRFLKSHPSVKKHGEKKGTMYSAL